jgi:hypothetical protein
VWTEWGEADTRNCSHPPPPPPGPLRGGGPRPPAPGTTQLRAVESLVHSPAAYSPSDFLQQDTGSCTQLTPRPSCRSSPPCSRRSTPATSSRRSPARSWSGWTRPCGHLYAEPWRAALDGGSLDGNPWMAANGSRGKIGGSHPIPLKVLPISPNAP